MNWLDDLTARPVKHSIEDGAIELMLGIQFSLMSGIAVLSTHTKFFSVAMSGWNIAVIFGCQWILRRLKDRVVVPRVGYVTPFIEGIKIHISWKDWEVDRTTRHYLLVAGALTVFTFGMIATGLKWGRPAFLNPAIGIASILAVAGIFAWTASAYMVPRYWSLAAWSLIVGAALYLRNGNPLENSMLMMMWVSIGWAVMGAIRFRNFLKANPRVGNE